MSGDTVRKTKQRKNQQKSKYDTFICCCPYPSGKPIETLFYEYLYKPFNMTRTSWYPARDPQMATGIISTGDDFEQVLVHENFLDSTFVVVSSHNVIAFCCSLNDVKMGGISTFQHKYTTRWHASMPPLTSHAPITMQMQLLSRLLTEKVLSKETTAMMETDWTKVMLG